MLETRKDNASIPNVIARWIKNRSLEHCVPDAGPRAILRQDPLELIAFARSARTEHRKTLEVEAAPVSAPVHRDVAGEHALVEGKQPRAVAPGYAPEPFRKNRVGDAFDGN